MDIATGTTLWFDNGLTVTVHGEPDMRKASIKALTLANGAALGAAVAGTAEDR